MDISRMSTEGTDLEGTDLEGTDLEGTDLEGTDLEGSRIAFLGGTSGIGLAAAHAAAARGAEVVVASSRTASVDRAVAGLPGARGHVADLGDPGAVQALVREIGPVDHLVYTAGEPLLLSPIRGLDLGWAREFLDVRLFGALAAISSADVSGSIVLTSGTAAARPGPGWGVGAAICGAIEALVRTFALELAPVRVNAVAPGVLRSPLWSAMDDEDREGLYAAEAARLPVRRIGEVADAANAILYLLGQDFTTGTVLGVDGGALLV